VNRIKAAGLFFAEAHGFDGDDRESRLLNARQNLALLACSNSVRLDDRERTFDSHSKIPPMIYKLLLPDERRLILSTKFKWSLAHRAQHA
jgi:hypothetical protein